MSMLTRKLWADARSLASQTIALMVLLLPMAKLRPMLVAAFVGGAAAIALRGMPLRLGLVVAIFAGIAAGFAAEHWHEKKNSGGAGA